MREIFDAAVESDYITVNPAGDAIRGSVKLWSSKRKVEHFKALPYQDVPLAFEQISYPESAWETTPAGNRYLAGPSQALREAQLALKFAILTAARSVEVREATWGEVDWEAGIWQISEGAHEERKGTQGSLIGAGQASVAGGKGSG